MSTSTATPESITRTELYELIWKEPMTKVAPKFGLSDVGLAKLCTQFDIPRPPAGYWAQKQVGKEPERTPLPPAKDVSGETIEFLKHALSLAAKVVVTAVDRVSDDGLKKLIAFENEPLNRIVVSENPGRFHHFVRATKASLTESRWHRQGLYSPSGSNDDGQLDIQVGKESVPRALRLMDAVLKAFEKRGHRAVAEQVNEYRKEVVLHILGERFTFRLREKTKMVRISESEQKKDIYSSRVKYEPTGDFNLQLLRKQTGYAETTWKDRKGNKLEEQLNEVMIELIVCVEKERNWRRQREENEKQQRREAAKRREEEQRRRKEEQKINELLQMVQNWDQAERIRAFMNDLRGRIQQRKGPIEEGSDLDQWVAWALNHADKIDPLGARLAETPVATDRNNWSPPAKPR